MVRALTALTIAPLEPDGRDGIFADLKSFSALGLHGAGAVTSVHGTALSAEAIAAQIEDVLRGMRVDAVKLTCPHDAAALLAIADVLLHHDVRRMVLDPAGAAGNAETLGVLKERLLPLALVAMPNLGEAQALTGRMIETWEDMREAASDIVAMGAANAVIKGGKRPGGQVTDILFDGNDYRDFTAERVEPMAPGAGTTFAAAATATLAKQETIQHSIATAKAYVTKALQSAYELGGLPSLHHFYRYWRAATPQDFNSPMQ